MDAFNIYADLRRVEFLLKRKDILEIEEAQIISNILLLSFEDCSNSNQVIQCFRSSFTISS